MSKQKTNPFDGILELGKTTWLTREIGLTSVLLFNDRFNQTLLCISHHGFEGHTITRDINPYLKEIGLKTISQLKRKYPYFTELGCLDNSWVIIFSISEKAAEVKSVS
jgi:hypothetical protein